jgi:hypothetical protein
MKVNLRSRTARAAIEYVKEQYNINNYRDLEHAVEKEYKCKVVYEDSCSVDGHLEMTDEKYISWFLIRFGDIK